MRFKSKHILSAFTFISIVMSNGTKAIADDQANFLKLIQDPAEQQLVLNTAKKARVVLSNPCDSAKFTLVNKFSIYEPLKFDSSGKIVSGAFKQTISEDGCGQNRALNVLVFVDPSNGELKATATLPGSTRADPLLQKDSIPHALIAARSLENPSCNSFYISDTQFLHETGEPLKGAKGNPWDELWTLNLCGKVAQVTMHFIPDKTGTTIHTSLNETKFL